LEQYRNLNGNSGVLAYKIGADSIEVEFTDRAAYLYTHASAGAQNIEKMKNLANQGYGLNGFINTMKKLLNA